ncbi:MAG: hypothetical protein UR22_C0001G0050 [Parcubacteria group bacterium GW2011_GWC2_32_10]|nr:MAG: hypothetical protein UR22_C0001G0050 [Parcubacteria group bacterium GW2011_GWC2_32_10]
MKVVICTFKSRFHYWALVKENGDLISLSNHLIDRDTIAETTTPIGEISDDCFGRDGVNLQTFGLTMSAQLALKLEEQRHNIGELMAITDELRATNRRLEQSIKDLLEANQQRQDEIAELRAELKNLKTRLKAFGNL